MRCSAAVTRGRWRERAQARRPAAQRAHRFRENRRRGAQTAVLTVTVPSALSPPPERSLEVTSHVRDTTRKTTEPVSTPSARILARFRHEVRRLQRDAQALLGGTAETPGETKQRNRQTLIDGVRLRTRHLLTGAGPGGASGVESGSVACGNATGSTRGPGPQPDPHPARPARHPIASGSRRPHASRPTSRGSGAPTEESIYRHPRHRSAPRHNAHRPTAPDNEHCPPFTFTRKVTGAHESPGRFQTSSSNSSDGASSSSAAIGSSRTGATPRSTMPIYRAAA